ncbi:MAG: BatA and WFA domain-containing protein [Planctomycetia bacterium]|nr:BatA and WFA domain-containing protein [Planctomycetia bacterium]
MSFANPIAWFLALAAGPIIVFYILKLRLRRLPVSTNLFWKQIYDEKPPRSIWQYLRHLLSLLAQLLLVAFLAAAVADPFFAWQLLEARRIVVVVDNSASMRASDIAPTRLQAAIDSAKALVEGLRFQDEMAIVLAGPRPEVVVGMSGHVPTLKRALEEIAPSDNPTDVESAIELGRQLIGEHPHGEVVVVTDGCWDAMVKPEGGQEVKLETKLAPVTYRVFATEAANVGITQFQVRRSLIDPLGYEVLIAMRNAGPSEVKCRVEMELAGLPVDILPLTLKPEEHWSRSLEKSSLEGGRLVAKLTQVAATASTSGDKPTESKAALNLLPTDDTAWAVLPEREIQKVLLITEGNLFLQKVFEANPLVRVETRKDFPDQWPADTLVVLHRQVLPLLPAGNLLVVDPAGSCDAWDLGETIENPIVTELDSASRLMTYVRLDNVLMPESKQLKYKSPPKVLAGAISKDAIYAEVTRANGKCLVLTVNLDRGDLAFRTAFPILVANALGWYAGETGELRESLATGSTAEVQLDIASQGERSAPLLRSPSGREQTLFPPADDETKKNTEESRNEAPQAASSISVGPLDECGVWNVVKSASEAETPLMSLAVNLASARESDLRPPREMAEQTTAESVVSNWLARPLWFYLLFAACALFLAEWFLYQRRVIT